MLEVDMLVIVCVAAAAIMGLIALLQSGESDVRTAETSVPVYYPVDYVAPATATSGQLRTRLDFPVANAIPPAAREAALAAVSTPPVKQLPDTGPGFITLLGDKWTDGHFYRSLTDFAQDFYGGRWAPENVVSSPAGTRFIVERESDGGPPFSIAEVRSRDLYGYGRYEVIMQPGKGSGLVTAFFTYTGPYVGDPHDEIDIEFLGKDLTKIHFNYWRNGSRGNYKTFDLPFDAGDAPHLYGFEWRPDKVTWFVDGQVYHETELNDRHVPIMPGRLYMSHWTGQPGMQAWHGPPTFQSGVATKVSCVSYTPLGEEARSCSNLKLVN